MEWDFYTKADEILKRYRAKCPGASEELINQFGVFLNKFSNIINNGTADLSNRNTRGFINLFVRNSMVKGNLHKASHSAFGMEVVNSTVSFIQQMFTSRYEKDEIDNIIIMTFLECADRYRPIDDKPRFHLYLTKCFHFELYNNLMSVIKDTLNIAMLEENYHSLEEVEFETATYDSYDLNDVSKANKILRTEEDIVVDDNWIIGFTADMFKDYSIFERNLLKMKFIDKHSDVLIAEEIGTSQKYLNEKKRVLLKKVENDIASRKLLKE